MVLSKLVEIILNYNISVFAFLIRSPYNNKLFVVAEEHSALKQSLDQLNLFSEDNPPSAAPVRMPSVLEI